MIRDAIIVRERVPRIVTDQIVMHQILCQQNTSQQKSMAVVPEDTVPGTVSNEGHRLGRAMQKD